MMMMMRRGWRNQIENTILFRTNGNVISCIIDLTINREIKYILIIRCFQMVPMYDVEPYKNNSSLLSITCRYINYSKLKRNQIIVTWYKFKLFFLPKCSKVHKTRYQTTMICGNVVWNPAKRIANLSFMNIARLLNSSLID